MNFRQTLVVGVLACGLLSGCSDTDINGKSFVHVSDDSWNLVAADQEGLEAEAKENTLVARVNSCWVYLGDKVFDVTAFVNSATNGSKYFEWCGKDIKELNSRLGANNDLMKYLTTQYGR